MERVFLDASYAIALASKPDQFHARATTLRKEMDERGVRFITTRAVILEIGNRLAKQRFRTEAVRLLESIELDPRIDVIPLSEELYRRAFALFQQRPDKEWGLADCVSFIVMKDHGLTEALSADEHFRQAGFRARLLE